ncbi:RpiR family transcriptional regulator [Azorhizobium oxalatiphilum]|uniref:RpiR family transcriptional regulator n=1 Tax=Azorhizobium oxalatiphilum TaxID=980631 RepID=A0A917FDX9_9HYPH|nr:MurR/RpiR family transcriptional regulator [Azorhizobium oxalatiphilum]GGF68738.1 RpiR family transcriptional regulator [Azorhizobium oxalatiphilum]
MKSNVPRSNASSQKERRTDRFGERLKSRSSTLSPSLLTVATYINDNRRSVLNQSALDIAAATGTSDATVIRAIQALGFEGLRDLKQTLSGFFGGALSSADKMASTTDALTADADSSIDFVCDGHLSGIDEIRSAPNREAFTQAIRILGEAAGIGIFGIGASGVLADYVARLFSRNGRPGYALNRTGISLAEQLLGMRAGDALVMMGQANAHREGMATILEAKRLGNPIILLTNAPNSTFAKEADVVIRVPRGRSEMVPLHGLVLMSLEIMVVGLAASEPERTQGSLERLHGFYEDIRKVPRS